MPQDTAYIHELSGPPPPVDVTYILPSGDTVILPDSFFGTGGFKTWVVEEQMRKEQEAQYQKEKSAATGNTLLLFFGLVIGFVFISYWGDNLPGWLAKRRRVRNAKKLLDEKGVLYHTWLEKYNPYYHSLSSEERQRFLERTTEFMLSKKFCYHSMVEEEHIPVLISGAAVQLTFGLKNFLMDYFSVIHVLRKEYLIPNLDDTYYGHVSRTGIHIAWNHFLYGFEDYTDCINVGLHEMAHAISYDVFLGKTDKHDSRFKKRLAKFREDGRPIFRALREGASHVLNDYATINFDEFWAVSIETFFENAEEFRGRCPDLYFSICSLLNQDTLIPGKILDRNLAGLAS